MDSSVPLSVSHDGGKQTGGTEVMGWTKRSEFPRRRDPHQFLPTWRHILNHNEGEGNGSWPVGRAGHALVAFSNHLYLFGGFSEEHHDERRRDLVGIREQEGGRGGEGGGGGAGGRDEAVERQQVGRCADWSLCTYNSIHEYNCVTAKWTLLTPVFSNGSSCPSPRRQASMVVYGGSLYVFGGFDKFHHVLGDLWEFKIEERRWEQVNTTSPLGSESRQDPTARAEHTAVMYKNQMIIFGGYDGKKKLNDTYVCNLLTREWMKIPSPVVNAPSRRCKHAAVIYDKRMYILGGFQFINGENFAQTDLHVLDCEEFSWSPIALQGDYPGALQGHKAVVCDDSMFVVGGKVRADANTASDGRSSELNQVLWQYRFDNSVWSVVSYAGNAPSPRQLHAVVALPGEDWRWSIYLFGGTDRDKAKYYDDLNELENLRSPLHADMRSLLNNDTFSDVVFVVEGRKIFAHRCILVARSDYFRSMFKSEMKEERETEIPIEEVSYDVFLSMLEFTYTDRVEVSGDMTIDLLKAANRFGLEGLRTKCEEQFSQSITIENAAYVCAVADQHEATNLRTFCIRFIVHNFLGVLETEGFQEMLLRRERLPLVLDILQQLGAESSATATALRHKRPRLSP